MDCQIMIRAPSERKKGPKEEFDVQDIPEDRWDGHKTKISD